MSNPYKHTDIVGIDSMLTYVDTLMVHLDHKERDASMVVGKGTTYNDILAEWSDHEDGAE